MKSWRGKGARLLMGASVAMGLSVMALVVVNREEAKNGVASPARQGAQLPKTATGSTMPSFRPVECWVSLARHRATCGVVTVPLSAEGRMQVDLAVVRVAGEGPITKPPLLFLGGGPGEPVIEGLSSSLAELLELAQGRELVFLDPRGTGYSKPKLECREKGALPESLSFCYEKHSVEFDPSAFTTAAGVKDVEAVRQALGYEQWDVLATSYGTRWALTLVRDAPQSVRAVVLDSPVPLQVDLIAQLGTNAYAALSRMLSACAAQPNCARAFPSLGEDLKSVVTSGVSEDKTQLDADHFVRVIFALLYTPAAAAYVPQIIHRAARGDFELFEQLERGLTSRGFSLGAHLSVQCAEEVPFTSEEAVREADAAVPSELRSLLSGRTYLEDCAIWRVAPAAQRENHSVLSKVPALIIVGDMDPVTPPAYAEMVHGDLPASRLLVVHGGAHAAALSSCGIQLIEAFLGRLGEPLELGCMRASPQEESEVLAEGQSARSGVPLVFRTEAPTTQEVEVVKAAL